MCAKHLAFALALLAAPAVSLPVLTAPAHAHEPRKGPNGGELVDAGAYHIEVIGRGSALEVLVSDATDKPLSAAGFKAMAIMVIDGRTHRIALEPSPDGKKLVGAAPSPISTVKGAVQLTSPDGKTATGRIN
jgi:hypothetical protein